METFSGSLALCEGNSLVTGEFPAQRPVTWSFDVFFDLRLNKHWVNNREACDLRPHHTNYDVTIMLSFHLALHKSCINFSLKSEIRLHPGLHDSLYKELYLFNLKNTFVSFIMLQVADVYHVEDGITHVQPVIRTLWKTLKSLAKSKICTAQILSEEFRFIVGPMTIPNVNQAYVKLWAVERKHY